MCIRDRGVDFIAVQYDKLFTFSLVGFIIVDVLAEDIIFGLLESAADINTLESLPVEKFRELCRRVVLNLFVVLDANDMIGDFLINKDLADSL